MAESQRQQEIKKANREKYKALRTKPANKTNQKINAVLDYLIAKENKENGNSNNKVNIQDSDEDIDNALRELGVINEEKSEKEQAEKEKANKEEDETKKADLVDDDDSDLEQIDNKNYNKKKLETTESTQDVMNSSPSTASFTSSITNNNATSSSFYGGSAINPHGQTPIYHTQRLYAFLDKVTAHGEMDDDDKQVLTLAFYDDKLKADIIPHFDSLCIQNKSFPEMAASLLFLVKCLKNNR